MRRRDARGVEWRFIVGRGIRGSKRWFVGLVSSCDKMYNHGGTLLRLIDVVM